VTNSKALDIDRRLFSSRIDSSIKEKPVAEIEGNIRRHRSPYVKVPIKVLTKRDALVEYLKFQRIRSCHFNHDKIILNEWKDVVKRYKLALQLYSRSRINFLKFALPGVNLSSNRVHIGAITKCIDCRNGARCIFERATPVLRMYLMLRNIKSIVSEQGPGGLCAWNNRLEYTLQHLFSLLPKKMRSRVSSRGLTASSKGRQLIP